MGGEYTHEGIIYQEPLPRIALVNFSEPTQQELRAKGHNTHLYPCHTTGRSKQILAPKPAHEIEILLVRDRAELITETLGGLNSAQPITTRISFGRNVNVMDGTTSSLDQYCRRIFDSGGLCVFFVSFPHGAILEQSGLWMNLEEHNRALTKSASLKPISNPGFEVLSTFLESWRTTPPQYVGIRPSVVAQHFFEDRAGNKLVLLHKQHNVQRPGIVLCLPDYGDRADILHALLSEVLPELSPYLFPHRFDSSWQHEPMFVHPSVSSLEGEKTTVRRSADIAITTLNQRIDDVKKEDQYLMDILLAGDDQLKKAVKKALEVLLAFTGMVAVKVLDVDDDPSLRDGSSQNREDLRIELGGKVLLIDVAGNDSPLKEGRINQLDKHKKLYLSSNPAATNYTHSVLLANYNKRGGTDPLKRGQMFGSGTTQANDRLKDAGHSAISTLDLFRLIRAAQQGEITLSQEVLVSFLTVEGILDFDTLQKRFRQGDQLRAERSTENSPQSDSSPSHIPADSSPQPVSPS